MRDSVGDYGDFVDRVVLCRPTYLPSSFADRVTVNQSSESAQMSPNQESLGEHAETEPSFFEKPGNVNAIIVGLWSCVCCLHWRICSTRILTRILPLKPRLLFKLGLDLSRLPRLCSWDDCFACF